MKIIQVADLHINPEMQIKKVENKLDKLFISLEKKLVKNEEIIFCICGDIVDKGNETMYSIAEEIFNYIKNLFIEYKLKFEFVPGNHDLCDMNLGPYNDFISKFIENSYDYNNKNTHLREYEDFDLILSNSVYHKNKTFGKLDLESIEQVISLKPSYLVIHHTLLSENDDDSSAIRNAYKLVNLIENKNIFGILHGHTHGYKDIMIGNQCKIIGVGPMLKEVPDINNQYNYIEMNGHIISKITNYRYSADLDEYLPRLVYDSKPTGQYFDNSLKKIYSKVVSDVKRLDCIYNLKMNLVTNFRSFEEEIKDTFPDFIEIAKDWQGEKVPESLYYNHGRYMQSKGILGIEHIIKELTNKATSSRAIIPLINFADVVDSGDQYLPSLNVIQFGFLEDTKRKIFATIYFRALEVNRFLKINLCEIYLMIKSIANIIRSIEEVDITIIAFRAQYKEKYGCFRKAKIDTLNEAELTVLLSNKKYDNIIDLLEEKLELSETVIEDKGINSIKNAIEVLTKEGESSVLLLEKVKKTQERLNLLKEERKKTSNYKEIEKTEQLVTDSIKDLIAGFRTENGNIS